jgi:hypothetical protein
MTSLIYFMESSDDIIKIANENGIATHLKDVDVGRTGAAAAAGLVTAAAINAIKRRNKRLTYAKTYPNIHNFQKNMRNRS